MCEKYKLSAGSNWWSYKGVENEEVKVFWDFRMQTNKHLPQHTPGIIIIDKKDKELWSVDIAISEEHWIEDKELEKTSKPKAVVQESENLLYSEGPQLHVENWTCFGWSTHGTNLALKFSWVRLHSEFHRSPKQDKFAGNFTRKHI